MGINYILRDNQKLIKQKWRSLHTFCNMKIKGIVLRIANQYVKKNQNAIGEKYIQNVEGILAIVVQDK